MVNGKYNALEKLFSIAEGDGEEAVVEAFYGVVKKYSGNFDVLSELYSLLCQKVLEHQRVPYHERFSELYDNISFNLESQIELLECAG